MPDDSSKPSNRMGAQAVGPMGTADYLGADEPDRPIDDGESQRPHSAHRTAPSVAAPAADIPSMMSAPQDGQ